MFKDLHQEEAEGSKSERDLGTADTEPESRITVEHMKLIQELLMRLQEGQRESAPESTVNTALNDLNLRDFPSLWRVRVQFVVQDQDPKLDVIF